MSNYTRMDFSMFLCIDTLINEAYKIVWICVFIMISKRFFIINISNAVPSN